MALASGIVPSQRAFSIDNAAVENAPHHRPPSDPHSRRVRSYIEEVPKPGYHWASPAAYEAFLDMKYGVRIHWGLYSVAGLAHESWPFLDLGYAERARFNEIY